MSAASFFWLSATQTDPRLEWKNYFFCNPTSRFTFYTFETINRKPVRKLKFSYVIVCTKTTSNICYKEYTIALCLTN
jgi:hypothetical protein